MSACAKAARDDNAPGQDGEPTLPSVIENVFPIIQQIYEDTAK